MDVCTGLTWEWDQQQPSMDEGGTRGALPSPMKYFLWIDWGRREVTALNGAPTSDSISLQRIVRIQWSHRWP